MSKIYKNSYVYWGTFHVWKTGATHPGWAGNLFTCPSYNIAFYRLGGATGKSFIYKKGKTVDEVSNSMSSCGTLNKTAEVHNNLNREFSLIDAETQTAGWSHNPLYVSK
jgi:hypothetical protein